MPMAISSGRWAVIAGVLSVLAAGITFRLGISPNWKAQAELSRELNVLKTQLNIAREELSQIKHEEQELARARISLERLLADTPTDPSITWLPGRMKTHLASHGVERVDIRLNTRLEDRTLPGYERCFWHLSLPRQPGLRKMTEALLAVAQLEQDDFIKIVDVSLHSETQEPGWSAAEINVMAFVRK